MVKKDMYHPHVQSQIKLKTKRCYPDCFSGIASSEICIYIRNYGTKCNTQYCPGQCLLVAPKILEEAPSPHNYENR